MCRKRHRHAFKTKSIFARLFLGESKVEQIHNILSANFIVSLCHTLMTRSSLTKLDRKFHFSEKKRCIHTYYTHTAPSHQIHKQLKNKTIGNATSRTWNYELLNIWIRQGLLNNGKDPHRKAHEAFFASGFFLFVPNDVR